MPSPELIQTRRESENNRKNNIISKEQYNNLCKKEQLSDDKIKEVVKYAKENRGFIELNLKTMTDEQAKLIATVDKVSLNGLTRITDKQAEKLGNETLCLHLDGLEMITDNQVTSLRKLRLLYVQGLKNITDNQIYLLNKKKQFHLFNEVSQTFCLEHVIFGKGTFSQNQKNLIRRLGYYEEEYYGNNNNHPTRRLKKRTNK